MKYQRSTTNYQSSNKKQIYKQNINYHLNNKNSISITAFKMPAFINYNHHIDVKQKQLRSISTYIPNHTTINQSNSLIIQNLNHINYHVNTANTKNNQLKYQTNHHQTSPQKYTSTRTYTNSPQYNFSINNHYHQFYRTSNNSPNSCIKNTNNFSPSFRYNNLQKYQQPKNSLFHQKMKKIQQQLRQENRQYQKKHNPFIYLKKQIVNKNQLQKQEKLKDKYDIYSSNKKNKTEATTTKLKTDQSFNFNPQVLPYNHQFDLQYEKKQLNKLQNQSIQIDKLNIQSKQVLQSQIFEPTQKIRFTSRKKIIYEQIQKQTIHYPQFMKDAAIARENSIIPLAKKGVVINYDAKFQPIKSNLLYQYAKKDSFLKNPYIGYRQNIQSKPISNYATTTEEKLASTLQQKTKQNIKKSYLEAYQARMLKVQRQKNNISKALNYQFKNDLKNNQSQPFSPIKLKKIQNFNLYSVQQQSNFHQKSCQNIHNFKQI